VAKNPFKKIRAIDDRTLYRVLGGHDILVRRLLKDRRVWLVLHVVEVVSVLALTYGLSRLVRP
jgi:hypothetical protein